MKKKQIHCPYCGAKASLRPASAVYGTATKVPDSYLYVCDRYPRCDSYVGAHIPYAVTKQIFRRDKRNSDEQKVMLLANQAMLSTAEMIKCAELNTFAFDSEDELIDTLYHDEYTTSENIAHSVRFLPQCRPVITSVANLYLRKQIIFERM